MTKRLGILIAVIAALVAGGLALGLGLMSNSHATETTPTAHTSSTTSTTTTTTPPRRRRRPPCRRPPCRRPPCRRPPCRRPPCRRPRRRQRHLQWLHRRPLSTVLPRTTAATMTPTTTEGRAMATETSDQVASLRRYETRSQRGPAFLVSPHAPHGVSQPARLGGRDPSSPVDEGIPGHPDRRPLLGGRGRWLRAGGSPAGVPACSVFRSQGFRSWPKGSSWSPSAAHEEG